MLIFNELELVPLAGLEPATQGLGIPCSIHTELQGYLRASENVPCRPSI
jgi:hypothetical protein